MSQRLPIITVDEGATSEVQRQLRAVALAAILWGLAEELSLHREYVVEDAVDSPAFQAVIGDHARVFQLASKRGS